MLLGQLNGYQKSSASRLLPPYLFANTNPGSINKFRDSYIAQGKRNDEQNKQEGRFQKRGDLIFFHCN